jgi:hypothetical protein
MSVASKSNVGEVKAERRALSMRGCPLRNATL